MATNPYNILANWNPIDPNVFGNYVRSNNLNSGQNPGNRPSSIPTRPSQQGSHTQEPTAPSPTGIQRTPRTGSTNTGSAAASAGAKVGASNPPAQPSYPSGNAPGVRTQATGSTSGGGGAGGQSSATKTQMAAAGSNVQPGADPIGAANQMGANAGSEQTGEYGSGGAKTAFGQSFIPGSYENIWDDPAIMIQEWLNQSGAPANTGSGAMTMDLADRIAANWLLLNNQGFTDGTAGTDTADFIDWSGGYIQNMRTPGGQVASTQDILGAITNPGEGSPMYNNMYGPNKTAEEQISSALNTTNYGLRGVTPALMAQSIMSRMEALGRQYQADIATGRDVEGGYANFGEYLRQNGIG